MTATTQAVAVQSLAAQHMTLAEVLSEFALSLQAEDIPQAVRERARHLILDSVGTALGGLGQSPTKNRWRLFSRVLPISVPFIAGST